MWWQTTPNIKRGEGLITLIQKKIKWLTILELIESELLINLKGSYIGWQ